MKPVSQGEHPPHIALTHPRAGLFGQLTKHRDGTRSAYVQDTTGNAVESLAVDDPIATDHARRQPEGCCRFQNHPHRYRVYADR